MHCSDPPFFAHFFPLESHNKGAIEASRLGALGYRSIVTIFSPLLLYYFHLDAPFRFGSPCANHDKRSTSVSYLQFSLECILYYVGNTDRERDVSFLNHRWIQDEVCCYDKKKFLIFLPLFILLCIYSTESGMILVLDYTHRKVASAAIA